MAATSAFAQSSVEIYGVIDQAYNNVKTSGIVNQKVTTIGAASANSANGSGNLQGSRIGFRGQEDIGGGNKAVFLLEYGINISGETNSTAANNVTGNTLGNMRQGFVGLSTAAGTFVTGTMYALHSDASGSNAAAFASGGTNQLVGAHSAFKYGTTFGAPRATNAVAYVSPTFNGFTAKVGKHFGETTQTDANSNKNNTGTTWAIDYNQGPLKAGYAQTNYKNIVLAAATAPAQVRPVIDLFGTADSPAAMSTLAADDRLDIEHKVMGARYDFGFATLGLHHAKFKEYNVADTAENIKAKHTALSASVPLTPTFTLNAARTTGKVASNEVDRYKTTGIDLIGVYTLSKRTNIYGGLAKVSYVAQENGQLDIRQKSTVVGLRHSF